ncbi:MAG: pimeloyl-ACP methyl ester carboxylesterase [Zhongshania sp.]|jgi:pimeloyl-ACP methyl ester carboxylesterase
MNITMFLHSLAGILTSPFNSNVHDGRVSSNPRLVDTLRYPLVEPPPGGSNQHGEIEVLPGGAEVVHWFAHVAGVNWHFVTAGDPANEPVLLIHGLPESWYAFHHQIAALTGAYYVVAIDMKGYGQSDKRRGLDYSNPIMAKELALLIDHLGLQTLHLVAHDRGSVLADYLTEVPGMSSRILHYVRMQQSGCEPHGYPRPPHKVFGSWVGVLLFRSRGFVKTIYRSNYVAHPISNAEIERLDFEFKYHGIGECVSENFQTTNFDFELKERMERLFQSMTMPVLFLQGGLDIGQHPEEYEGIGEYVKNATLQIIDAGHFLHLERPDEVSLAIHHFLQHGSAA